MRLVGIFSLVLALSGFCAAQETNFPVGPQYLITNGSPLFAQPINTPSLQLGTPLETISSLTTRRGASEAGVPLPELGGHVDFYQIYYGVPTVNVVEIKHEAFEKPLPTSIVNAGVVEVTDVESLHQRGFGVTLPENATFWKAHKRHAVRVYTNTDIDKLHH